MLPRQIASEFRETSVKDRQLLQLVRLQLGKELYAAELVTYLGIPPEAQHASITPVKLYICYLKHGFY